MTTPVLLLLGPSGAFEVADVDAPQVSVLDLGVTRGDGVFESIGVVEGRAQAMEPHLARLTKSAAMLDLPAPDLDAWRTAVLRAVELADDTAPELLVKLIYTRGIEGDPAAAPTGWVHLFEAGGFDAERTAGIDVITLDRGYRSDVAQTSPWLLQGAKTLSYAVNKAALREAARRGAHDVIFVSTDGVVLEGPNSTVIALIDGVYVTTPSDLGVLEGTTQGAFFDSVAASGSTVEYRAMTVDELRGASAVWLASSGRQIAPVRSLDGVAVASDAGLTADGVATLLAR